MLSFEGIIDEISTQTITFSSEFEVTPINAKIWLEEQSKKIDAKSPLFSNKIIINSRITLLIPGRFDYLYPGDYLLTWDNKPPTHQDVCDALRRVIINSKNDPFTEYKHWIELLEDVYEYGTTHLDKSRDACERFAKQLIFWITLQEDINREKNLGRLIPFCRYAEAISTTQKGYTDKYQEVISRLFSSCPMMLEKWELPITPSYYRWCAF